MPVNPTYGTSLLQPQPAGGAGLTDPLEFMRTMAQTQNAINQNVAFQQEQAGKMRFGQIVSSSGGSLEDKFVAAMQDPVAAPYAAPLIGQLRQSQLALIQSHGEVQKQTLSGFNAVGQGLAALATNPNMTRDQYDSMIASRMSMLSPEARQNSAWGVAQMGSYLWDGLEGLSPEQAATERMKRVSGLLASTGMDPSTIRGLTGQIAPQVQEYTDPTDPTGAKRLGILGGPLGGGVGITPIQPAGGGPMSASPPPPGQVPSAAPSQAGPSQQIQQQQAGVLAGPSLATQKDIEMQATREKEVGDNISALSERLPNEAQMINRLQDALQGFTPGGLTPARAEAARAIVALGDIVGANPAKVRALSQKIMTSGGDLADFDAFNELINPYAVTLLKNSMSGTGRVMRPEVDAFMGMLDAAKDPRALMMALNYGKMAMRMTTDKVNRWPQFAADVHAGKIPGAFHAGDYLNWWTQQAGRPDWTLPGEQSGFSLASRPGPDGVYDTRDPRELDLLPYGIRYRRPGDDPGGSRPYLPPRTFPAGVAGVGAY